MQVNDKPYAASFFKDNRSSAQHSRIPQEKTYNGYITCHLNFLLQRNNTEIGR